MKKSVNNAFTVDVEDYFHVSAFENNISRKNWADMECRVEKNTHRILDLLDEHGHKGTFFVLGWVADRYPGLVREIGDRGHEVACHGYSHKLIYNQTPDEFREETIKAKQLLEDQVQVKVHGYRAASYSITQDSLWALDILADAGFTYDSSIYPVYHDKYGIPGAKEQPHVMSTLNGASIIEFPLSVFKLLRYNLPVSGGGYFRLYPFLFTEYALKSLNKSEMSFIFYMHPWEIDPGQPKIKSSFLSRFRHYNNLDKCENRLNKLLSAFNFITVSEALEEHGLVRNN